MIVFLEYILLIIIVYLIVLAFIAPLIAIHLYLYDRETFDWAFDQIKEKTRMWK
jgi:hypothetical protein